MTGSKIIRALKLIFYHRSSKKNVSRKARLVTSLKTGGAVVGTFVLKLWEVFLVNLLIKFEFVRINYSPLFFCFNLL